MSAPAPITAGSGDGPAAVHAAWNMGGRICDLAPYHLDRIAEMIDALPVRPSFLVDADIVLAESAGLRRLAEALDIPDDVLFLHDRFTVSDMNPAHQSEER
jgi:hypothetical protein